MAVADVSSSGSVLTVSYDKADLKRFEEALKDIDHNTPVDLAWAKNRTATYTQRLLASYAASRYRIKKSTVRTHILKRSANASGRNAVLAIRDETRPLSEFRVTHPKKAEPKGAQLKGNGVKPLTIGTANKVFWATMKSGHIGVFRRKGRSRLPIKQLMGTSIPKMMDNSSGEGAWQKARDEVAAKLLEYTEKRMQYRIRKAAAGGKFE